MMPTACAAVRPLSASQMINTASCGSMRPCSVNSSAKLCPCSISITMYGPSGDSPRSRMSQMCGSPMRPAAVASFWNRCSVRGLRANSGCMTLIATRFRTRKFSAIHTVLIPPSPSCLMKRKRWSSTRPSSGNNRFVLGQSNSSSGCCALQWGHGESCPGSPIAGMYSSPRPGMRGPSFGLWSRPCAIPRQTRRVRSREARRCA